ncbi:MAG: LysR family transcriptional regulator [Myxococcota bacterium]
MNVMRAFVRLVELGTFSAVANEMGVKQSTVSKWLAALEESVGISLLDRTTRSQRLTEAGELFFSRASDLIRDYDELFDELQQKRSDPKGRVRVSVPVVFGRLFVVPSIVDYLDRYPGISVEIVFNDRYVSLVDEGFDVAIRVGIPVDSSLRSFALGEGKRRLVASPTYLERAGRPERPQELANHECLVHAEVAAGTVWQFTRGSERTRVQVGGRVAANNSEAVLALARSGLGLCLLASWLVEDDVRSGRLVPVLEDFSCERAPIRALTPPGRLVHPRVRTLIDHFRESFARVESISA